MLLIFEIKNMQFFKLCLKISTLAVLLLTFCVLPRCCFRKVKWDECVDNHAWLTLKIMKILQGVPIFLCLDISYASICLCRILAAQAWSYYYHRIVRCSSLTYLLASQLVKKFFSFYTTRRFITAFTTALHLSLSWATSIQSMAPTHFLKIQLNIILTSTPGSSKWSLSFRFPLQNRVYNSTVPHTFYLPNLHHSSRFGHPNNIGWRIQIITLLIM